MRTLNAFYFSGTGNTRYVTRRLCQKLSVKFRTSAYDITDKTDFSALLKGADIILLAYPVYGSVRPYLCVNSCTDMAQISQVKRS